MWRLFIFLVLLVSTAEASDYDSLNILEITFTNKSRQDKDNVPHFICDHNDTSKKYTVLEGKNFNIITIHTASIIHVICSYTNNQKKYNYEISAIFRKTTMTFIAKKKMGTLWNCTVLTDQDTAVVQPVVLYEGHTYSATYCYMQIHVRQTKPPQIIRVNNMALQAVRTDLSEKDVDFTAEYQYADGDLVNVACLSLFETVTMEYPMADMLSDKFSSRNTSSACNFVEKRITSIGFSTKLHAGHNNSYMICTNTERTDYTKVMLKFVMRTEFNNIVSIKINGMTLRPKLINQEYNQYIIEYQYSRYLPIKVVCEVERTDVVLVVTDKIEGFVGQVNGYSKTDIIPSKLSEMSFHLRGEDKKLACGSDYLDGRSAELITINFSEDTLHYEQHPLHMELPRNGIVMKLYGYRFSISRHVIFYEFEDDERLQLKCGRLHLGLAVSYLQFKDSTCRSNGCYATQNLTLTDEDDNSEIVCRLMKQRSLAPSKEDNVLKEIRVIFRKRVLTTTTTTTNTTATTTTTSVQPTADQTNILAYSLSAVGVLIFVALLLVYLKAQKRCCYRSMAQRPLPPLPSRPDPAAGAYYENMLSVFAAINEREAEALENHYEEIQ